MGYSCFKKFPELLQMRPQVLTNDLRQEIKQPDKSC